MPAYYMVYFLKNNNHKDCLMQLTDKFQCIVIISYFINTQSNYFILIL